MPRIGTQKTSTVLTLGLLPGATALDSETLKVNDMNSARLYATYTHADPAGQLMIQIYVSPTASGPFIFVEPAKYTTVGTTQDLIIDIDLTHVARFKVTCTEVGNTAAPGTVTGTVIVSSAKSLTVQGKTPITALGDLIVGNASGDPVKLGIGSTGQVLKVAGGTATWAAESGGSSLPTASGAGELPVSTGAGTTYTATSRAQVVGGGLVTILTGSPSGGAIISDGAGDITVTSTDVSAMLAAANNAAILSAIGAASAVSPTVNDFSSATGLTLTNGTGTASVTGGVAQLSHGAGTAYRGGTLDYNGPSITTDLGSAYDIDNGYLDVAARISSMSAVATTQASLEIAASSSGGVRRGVLAAHDGTVYLYNHETSSVVTATAAAALDFTGGQGWIRVRASLGTVRAYYGVGVGGARPTSWTQVGTGTALSTPLRYVAIAQVVVSTGSTSTLDFDDLTVLVSNGNVL